MLGARRRCVGVAHVGCEVDGERAAVVAALSSFLLTGPAPFLLCRRIVDVTYRERTSAVVRPAQSLRPASTLLACRPSLVSPDGTDRERASGALVVSTQRTRRLPALCATRPLPLSPSLRGRVRVRLLSSNSPSVSTVLFWRTNVDATYQTPASGDLRGEGRRVMCRRAVSIDIPGVDMR